MLGAKSNSFRDTGIPKHGSQSSSDLHRTLGTDSKHRVYGVCRGDREFNQKRASTPILIQPANGVSEFRSQEFGNSETMKSETGIIKIKLEIIFEMISQSRGKMNP